MQLVSGLVSDHGPQRVRHDDLGVRVDQGTDPALDLRVHVLVGQIPRDLPQRLHHHPLGQRDTESRERLQPDQAVDHRPQRGANALGLACRALKLPLRGDTVGLTAGVLGGPLQPLPAELLGELPLGLVELLRTALLVLGQEQVAVEGHPDVDLLGPPQLVGEVGIPGDPDTSGEAGQPVGFQTVRRLLFLRDPVDEHDLRHAAEVIVTG